MNNVGILFLVLSALFINFSLALVIVKYLNINQNNFTVVYWFIYVVLCLSELFLALGIVYI